MQKSQSGTEEKEFKGCTSTFKRQRTWFDVIQLEKSENTKFNVFMEKLTENSHQ